MTMQPIPGQPVYAGLPGVISPPPGQPPQYGAPATPPAYGAPAPGQPVPGQIMLPPAEIKWSGLTAGGGKVPVISFIGRLSEIVEDNRQYGLYLIEKYDQVQILESPVPWPWATIDVPIKYSEKEKSGWGYHVESAKALGLALNATNLGEAKADLVGKVYEMRQSEQGYGDDRTTGQAMKGDVWKFVRIVTAGQPAVFSQPQYATPPLAGAVAPALAPAPASAPASAIPAPEPVAQAVVPTPTPALAPASAPATAPAGTFDCTISPDDTAEVRAKKLLNGKALNEWLGVALIDDKVKANPSFINTIYDQSFILGLKASNQAILGTDGKFSIIA